MDTQKPACQQTLPSPLPTLLVVSASIVLHSSINRP